MTVHQKTTIKSYFETGDRPTQAEFGDLIDSYQDYSPALDAIASAAVSGRQGFVKLTSSSGASVVATNVITPEEKGAKGTGEGNDALYLQAAIDAAVTGGTIALPQTYRLESEVSCRNKSINIIGPGTIIQGADIIPITLRASANPIVDIASIDYDVAHVFAPATAATSVARVELASSANVGVGKFVKIYSNDQIPGGNPGEKVGEIGRVGAVSGLTVYLNDKLRETYVTSPKLAVLKDQHRFNISGVKFTADVAGSAAEWTSDMLRIIGAVNPIVRDCEFRDGYGTGVRFLGCLGHDASVYVESLENNPTNLQFGYGIFDSSSEYGRIHDSLFINTRHGYTTGTDDNPATPYEYGRSYGTIVSNSVGFACAGAAFDTHGDAINITYNTCHALGSYNGENSLGSGFTFRGRQNRAENCLVVGCERGYNISVGASGGNQDTQIINSDSRDCSIPIRLSSTVSGGIAERPRVRGGHHDHSALSVIRAGDVSDGTIENLSVRLKSATTANRVLEVASAATFRMKNIEVNNKDGGTAIKNRLIRSTGTGNTVELDGARIIASSANWAGVLDAGSTNVVCYFKNVNSDVAPSDTNGVTNVGSATWAGEINVNDGRISSTNLISMRVSASTVTVTANHTIGQHIVVDCTANISAAQITEITDGVLIPQIMYLRNSDASLNALKVKDGNQIVLKSGSTLTLEPGEGAIFTWDGTNWHGLVGEQ